MLSAQYDVIFFGGGLATGMAARFAKLKSPNLKILILEKNTDTQWSPGESTVGVAAMHMIRDLGLSTYLYLNHLPKNGLRYFFLPEDKKADFDTASEIGSNILPIFPTFQVDRKRLDRDLWEMNKAIGIEIKTGVQWTDSDIVLGEGEALHRVCYLDQGLKHEALCRWMIEGQGRRATYFNQYSPITIDTDHNTGGAWGRFTNIQDIDLQGSKSWKQRVGYTARYLSTNHFMGRGYWIWVIPIARGVVSFGVVYDKNLIEDLTTNEKFLQFLNANPLVASLLKGSEQKDFQSGQHLPFKAKDFCSERRFALIGDSHMFVDPFYSPGSDVLSRQCYLVHHLVSAPDTKEISRRVQLFNDLQRLEFEVFKLLYVNQYKIFGSYEVYNIKALWDFHSYTNRILWNFYSEKYSDLSWLEHEVQFQRRGFGVVKAIQKGFEDLGDYFYAQGSQYFRQNLGHYSLRQNRFRIEEQMLKGEYSDQKSLHAHLHLCRASISEMVESRFSIQGFLKRKIIQDQLLFTNMETFVLNEDWVNQLLGKVAKQIHRALVRISPSAPEFAFKLEDLSNDKPKVLLDLPDSIKQSALDLWNEEAENTVLRDLLQT